MRPEDLGIGELFDRIRDDAKTQRIVLWNPAAAKMFGYSPSEALELRVEAPVPGYIKARHRAGMAREPGAGTSVVAEVPLPASEDTDHAG